MNRRYINLTVIVLITALLFYGIYYSYVTEPLVTVTSISVTLNGGASSYVKVDGKSLAGVPPITIKSSSFFEYVINFTNTANSTVYVTAVYTNTKGFSIPTTYLSQSLPYAIPPRGTRTLDVTIETPSSSYSGPMSIIINMSYTGK